MSVAGGQLGLALQLRVDATFGNFLPLNPATTLARTALQDSLAGEPAVLYLHGPAGSGRTHLLQACCHAVAARSQQAIYLPLAELQAAGPGILQGLENLTLVCLDDVQAVAGDGAWEEALFHVFNRLKDHRRWLVMAASQPPQALGIRLPDLQSRLAAATVFRLELPDDAARAALLQARAVALGLVLDDETAQFLLARAPRDTHGLLALLDTLDAAALAGKRRLTVPFVKTVMGW